ncbi:growth arrest and DNA damage-inducible proteins-interacting protein 1 [Pieris rapae]|uniref:growth arrest and DNA damage-inducible proteins-interacting protein 1 n=1 Tax=Pieris rapae TaxID=64459 RepID=UPI001E27D5F5|nr:growth arrest and DNA damage-inducible proteins-interacting protein 1 [Pieris rapae]
MNRYIKPKLLRSYFINTTRSTTTVPEIEQNEQVIIDDTEDALAKEAEIEKKRNISRLSQAHHDVMNGRRPYEQPKHIAHLTVKFNRKMYGKYGAASGVNPSICWPTQKDIEQRREFEAVAFPFTIPEMIATAAQKRREEQLKIQQRDNEIATKFAKLDQWKKELQEKMAKKSAEVEAAKIKKERLVEEVRRHFGFTLDPRDERFQEMLAKREKEQKKREKQARVEAREKLMIAKLQQKKGEVAENSSK